MMNIYASNNNVVLHPLTTAPWLSKQYTHIHLHAITLLATLALARLASTTSPSLFFLLPNESDRLPRVSAALIRPCKVSISRRRHAICYHCALLMHKDP